MKKLTLLIMLCFPSMISAQLWTGILPSSNAMDWTGAGVVGGIPSALWTQCGPTIAAYTGTAAAINTAITSCGTNQFVQLGIGTFNLSTAITFGGKSNTVLRGSGSNLTFITFSAAVSVNCNGFTGALGMCGTDGTYFNSAPLGNWTAGYAQGSNQITVSNTTGIVANSTIVVINQCDDGYSGHPCAGTAVDNGDYFNCGDAFTISPTLGCSFNGPNSGNGTTHRYQTEMSLVTNIAGSVLTLAQPLRHPQWASARSPEIWILTSPITNSGIENLSLDFAGTSVSGIRIVDAYNVWIKRVRIINAFDQAIFPLEASHVSIVDNYIYNARLNGSDSSCLAVTVVADLLYQNNICQQARYPIFFEGPAVGTVSGYNYINGNTPITNTMGSSFRGHANGDDYGLFEGNETGNDYCEDYHGSNLMNTDYRNHFTGWLSIPATPQTYQTDAILVDAYCRYHNSIANVLGTPGYHTNYQDSANQQQTANFQSIYLIGSGNSGVSPAVPNDAVALKTLFRWGNWDNVSSGVGIRWCGTSSNTGWASICGSVSEVPTGANCTTCAYPIPVPTKGDTGSALPASFYLSSRPSWFPLTTPWPPIGPDVTSGNIGQCSGTLNTVGQFNGMASLTNAICGNHGITASAWGGHVNAIPAMTCALVTMGMPPDGSGGALAFDPAICYPTTPVVTPPPAPCPTCFVAVPPTVPPVPITNISVSPKRTYVTTKGCSQDGITYNLLCPFRIFCTGCTLSTLVTLDGKTVAGIFKPGEIDVNVPMSMLPTPTVETTHKFDLTNPPNAVVLP